MGTALGALHRWERAGLGLPELDRSEVRDAAGGLQIACLTPAPPGDMGPNIARIACWIRTWRAPWALDALDGLLGSLEEAAPTTAGDALTRWRAALAEDLAARRS